MPSGVRLAIVGIASISLLSALALRPGPAADQSNFSARSLLPSGRSLPPHLPGEPQKTNGLPTVIALDPTGHYAALLNNGYGAADSGTRQSIALVDLARNQLTDFPDDRLGESAPQSYFLGLAFSTDGSHLYASFGSITDPTGAKQGSTGNGIAVYRLDQGKITPERFLKIGAQAVAADKVIAQGLFKLGRGQAIPYPAGLAVVAHDGHDQLLIANNLSDNVILVDAETGRELEHFDLSQHRLIPAEFPYTVVVTHDGRRAWCSLWNASKVAELELASGKVVRTISLREPKVATDPGSHPTALLLSADDSELYVALSNADLVAAVDTARGEPSAWFSTLLPGQQSTGSVPNSLALSGDGKLLFSANAGTNSVAVFETNKPVETSKPQPALGFIPTEWYPSAIAARGDDLWIASGKGRGTGANAQRNAAENHSQRRHEFPYIPTLLHGSVAHLKIRDLRKQLPDFTRAAQDENLLLAEARSFPFANGHNPIHHVIYIVKENRTYDQILGDLKVGDGDPSLVQYGEDVTPNQHQLALQFGVLDNFYDSGEVSGNGHMWSLAATTTDYNEKTWQITYRGSERTYDYEGLVADEYPLQHNLPDVNEPQSKYLFSNAAAHALTYRHYGEFVATEWCEEKRPAASPSPKAGTPPPPGKECPKTSIAFGQPLPAHLGRPKGSPSPYPWSIPIIERDVATKPELRDHFDPNFADFEPNYPDQLRVDEFLNEFDGFVHSRGKRDQELPNYVLLRLPNDHTAGKKAGSPTPAASVADNDLAVGRVVEAVSHSPYWEDTVIFILEDDAQDGADHVDAHRSTAFVISKYAPGSAGHPAVHHEFFTTVSLVHTLEALVGLPPMNVNDAYAPLMTDLFLGKGDQTPFTADYRNQNNGLIYTANAPAGPGAKESAKLDFSHADAADSRTLNAILWRDRKGSQPMPHVRHIVRRRNDVMRNDVREE
jgi:DNA-binding beta-propeller fold protein YncE